MGTEDPGERLAVLETQVMHLLKANEARATREWAIIMAVFGLLLTLFGQNLGWFK
jgi:hypothetical protein